MLNSDYFGSVPNKGRYLRRGKRPFAGSVLFPLLLWKSQGLIPCFLLFFLKFLFQSNKNPVCIVFYAVLFS